VPTNDNNGHLTVITLLKPEAGLDITSGVIRFYALEDMRKYIKNLLDSYQREYDRSSNVIGSMLRDKKGAQEVIQSRGWSKVGEVFINSIEPGRGSMEVIFQLLNEMKPRISKTEEVLRSFDVVENISVEEGATFLLFLRNGIPERIIVDSTVKRPEKFGYKAMLKAV
jgi:hypothetical protein